MSASGSCSHFRTRHADSQKLEKQMRASDAEFKWAVEEFSNARRNKI